MTTAKRTGLMKPRSNWVCFFVLFRARYS